MENLTTSKKTLRSTHSKLKQNFRALQIRNLFIKESDLKKCLFSGQITTKEYQKRNKMLQVA